MRDIVRGLRLAFVATAVTISACGSKEAPPAPDNKPPTARLRRPEKLSIRRPPQPEIRPRSQLANDVGPAGGGFAHAGAELRIPAGALARGTRLEIQRVGDESLPPFPPGLINVTDGGGGFRFLPENQRFEPKVTVALPLRSAGAAARPEYWAALGVRTFFWNAPAGRWEPLERGEVSSDGRRLASATAHFTLMINAIVQAPEHAGPANFDENAIGSIAAADPLTGVDLIEPPQANGRGDAEVVFPIRLPAGRGSHTPELSLRYSSANGNGELGVGWQLPVSRVSVDTRWGVPLYDDSERYLVNGAALIRVTRDQRTCRGSGEVRRQFATRTYDHRRVLLCEGTQGAYWEVTGTDGTRFDYGVDEAHRVADPSRPARIAEWLLQRVEDPNGNVTTYDYQPDRTPAAQGVDTVQMYLRQIDYTGHAGGADPAYRVSIAWSCGESARPDRRLSARYGFVTSTRCLLRSVAVLARRPSGGPPPSPPQVCYGAQDWASYQAVRCYELNYEDSELDGAKLLTRIKVRGADGNEWYEHGFSYTDPELGDASASAPLGFDTVRTWDLSLPGVPNPLSRPDWPLSVVDEEHHELSQSGGFAVRLGAGEGANIGCTVGGSTSLSLELPRPELKLIDINGDGIADRVWVQADGSIQAALGQIATDGGLQGLGGANDEQRSRVNGIPVIGSQTAFGGSQSGDARCGVGPLSATATHTISLRATASGDLLRDADGDGRVDLVSGDGYYRGLPNLCRDGSPSPSGACADGLPVCASPTLLCFAPYRSLSAASRTARAVVSRPPPPEPAPRRSLAASAPKTLTPVGTRPRDAGHEQLLSALTPGRPQLAPRPPRGRLAPPDAAPLVPEANWGPYTSAARRMAAEGDAAATFEPVRPIVRWDAQHTGTVRVHARMRLAHAGDKDGVKVSLLRIADRDAPDGTELLREVTLSPATTTWVDLGEDRSVDVAFGQSLVIVYDPLEESAVTETGILLDETESDIEITYTHVCRPGGGCRQMDASELPHRGPNGELAYVYRYPNDFRTSELPRQLYWQLLPPLGPPHRLSTGLTVSSAVVGVIAKTQATDTPVHIRVRCESMGSKRAGDQHVCPLGTILQDVSFGVAETGARSLVAVAPAPFVSGGQAPQPNADCRAYDRPSLQIRQNVQMGWWELIDDLSILMGATTEAAAARALAVAKRHEKMCFLGRGPGASQDPIYAHGYFSGEVSEAASGAEQTNNDCVTYDPGALNVAQASNGLWLLRAGDVRLMAFESRDAAELGRLVATPYSQQCFVGRDNTLKGDTYTTRHRTFVTEYFAGPLANLFDPTRILVEVDGEDGKEVPPQAVQVKALLAITSLREMEGRGPQGGNGVVVGTDKIRKFDRGEIMAVPLRVLHRVHPARNLRGFFMWRKDQRLYVTATASRLGSPVHIGLFDESSDQPVWQEVLYPEDQPAGQSGFARSFVVTIPDLSKKARRLYLRAYTEATFDPATSIDVKATIGYVSPSMGEPFKVALLYSAARPVQDVGDVNRPGRVILLPDADDSNWVAEAIAPRADRIFVHADSVELADGRMLRFDAAGTIVMPGGTTISRIDPNASPALVKIGTSPPVPLNGAVAAAHLVAAGEASAMLVRYDRIPAPSELPAGTMGCCPATDCTIQPTGCTDQRPSLFVSSIDVPVNLLRADYGDGYRGDRIVGEVPHSLEPFAGGHHGFFYGFFDGHETLACIGPYPCGKRPPRPEPRPPLAEPTTAAAAPPPYPFALAVAPPPPPPGATCAADDTSCCTVEAYHDPHGVQFAAVVRDDQRASVATYDDLNDPAITLAAPYHYGASWAAELRAPRARHLTLTDFGVRLPDGTRLEFDADGVITLPRGTRITRTSGGLDVRIGSSPPFPLDSASAAVYLTAAGEASAAVVPRQAWPAPIPAGVFPCCPPVDCPAGGASCGDPPPHWLYTLATCTDGCERDSDADGIPNCRDACPFEPEDRDGVLDGDGCVDGATSHPPGRFEGGTTNPGDGGGGCFLGGAESASICGGGHTTPSHRHGNGGAGPSGGSSGGSVSLDGIQRTWVIGLNASQGVGVGEAGVGIGVSGNINIGAQYTDRDLMDWNGDGIVDYASPNIIFLGGRGVRVELPLPCYSLFAGACIVLPGVRQSITSTIGFGVNAGASGKKEIKTNSAGRLLESVNAGVTFGLGAQFTHANTITDRFDVNGDGLPDQIVGREGNGSLVVLLNVGSGLTEPVRFPVLGSLPNVGSNVVQQLNEWVIRALSGRGSRGFAATDGFTRSDSSGFSAGVYFFLWGGSVSFSHSNNLTITQGLEAFTDLNGDGLVDLVFKEISGNRLHVAFNMGDHFAATRAFSVPGWDNAPDDQNILFGLDVFLRRLMPRSPDPAELSGSTNETWAGASDAVVWTISGGTSYSNTQGLSTVSSTLSDVDGDGIPDRVLRTGRDRQGRLQVMRGLFGRANLLRRIDRPAGGVIQLQYARAATTEDAAGARWNLARVTVDQRNEVHAALCGSASPQACAAERAPAVVTTFTYADRYYDRYEKESFGYRIVRATRNADGRVVEHEHANRDYWLHGTLVAERVVDATGAPLTETLWTYDTAPWPGITAANGDECLAQLILPQRYLDTGPLRAGQRTPCDVRAPRLVKTEQKHHERGTDSVVFTQTVDEYDVHGNPKKITEHHEGANQSTLVATIDYDTRAALVAQNIVDRASGIVVRSDSATGALLRRRKAQYDDRGNLTRHETWADAAGSPGKTAAVDITPDAFGFVTHVADANGYEITYTPDDLTHTVPVDTRDSFGLSATAAHDARFQLVTDVTDVNGNVIERRYDAFGRVASVRGPYERAAGVDSVSVRHGSLVGATYPVSSVTISSAVDPDTNQVHTTLQVAHFADGLGRPIQSQTLADVDGQLGRVVSGGVQLDGAGRRVAVSDPVFAPGTQLQYHVVPWNPSNCTTVGPVYCTRTTYDSLDRTVSVTAPGGITTASAYGLANHPRDGSRKLRRTEITDPTGKVRRLYHDTADRLVAVVEVLGGRELNTTYEYSPVGELIAIRDARDVMRTFEHDLAGRRTAVVTPDTGRLEMGYDAMGNVVARTDQQLCGAPPPLLAACGPLVVRRRYVRNRLVAVDYPRSVDAQFVYGDDDPQGLCAGSANAKGRICWLQDGAGTERRSFGALGELREQERTLPLFGGSTETRAYRTSFRHDSFGRLLRLDYPDGERLTYTYDAAGRVKSVSGVRAGSASAYVQDRTYDVFGKPLATLLGNGVAEHNEYEEGTQRLKRRVVARGEQLLSSFEISRYDNASNVLASVTQRNEGHDVVRLDRSYTYDDLHRLDTFTVVGVGATGTNVLSVAGDYDYDDVGNITQQKQVGGGAAAEVSRDWPYAYVSASRPNLPDTIGRTAFAYDKRGAVARITDRTGVSTFSWNEAGQLDGVTLPGRDATRYRYSSDGARQWRQTTNVEASGTTTDLFHYPSPYYTAAVRREQPAGCADAACIVLVPTRTKHVRIGGTTVASVVGIVDPAFAGDETAIPYVTVAPSYLHADPVQSTASVTGGTATVERVYEYLPFGEVLKGASTPEAGALISFASWNGMELEGETGLSNFGARSYHGALGRWIQPDPRFLAEPERDLDDPAASNLYAYAGNNPIRYRDPSGLQRMPAPFVTIHTTPEITEAGRKMEAVGGAIMEGFVFGVECTDLDDAAVLVTWATTGGGQAIHVFGEEADNWDVAIAAAGVFLPAISGGLAKRVGGKLVEGAEWTAKHVSGGAWQGIGATGKLGEEALKALGGESQAFRQTSRGARYIDQLVNGVAHESKVGYTSLTKNIKEQIAKDVELIQSGQISEAVWHFFESPVTGKGGPSAPLREALQEAGIKIETH